MDEQGNDVDDASLKTDSSKTDPPEGNENTGSKPEEQIGRIKGTGVFDVPDGRDPSTKAAIKEANKDLVEEEFSGYCGHCSRPMNVGRPEAKCVPCGMIVHQFCFDAHAIKKHRPDAVSIRIESREGKFFAVIGKAER